ncbi:MAG: TonB-dependent receptor [Pseudomonadales bacterium]|nr:TonB-dependent receptor [Pseudomonadales bacterium]
MCSSKLKRALPFRKSLPLAISSAIAMSAMSGTAMAQSEVEEIVVTGIRGSLTRAMDIKRNAGNVVDAISAEDIGKFPDTNLAEALQRISGVSIDRDGGEGQQVTVRGFGPQFNTVLVNGRNIATDSSGRQFQFDNLAAELISGVDVYKTSNAGLSEGGIGSTIDIRTARPLDLRGFTAAASAKGVHDLLSDDTEPQISGLISNIFADGRVGVLVSASRQERSSRVDQIQTRGFNPGTTLNLADGRTLTDVFVPQNFDKQVFTEDRERTGGTLTLQFQPSDRLLITADALYSKFEVESDVNSIGWWFTASEILDAEVDANNTVTSLTHSTNGATDFIQTNDNRDSETKLFAVNIEWDATDSLRFTADAAYSEAEDMNGGKNNFIVSGFNDGVSFDLPAASISSPILTAGLTPDLGRAHIAIRQGADIEDEITDLKFKGEWTSSNETLKKVDFGVTYSDRTKTNDIVATNPNALCHFCGYLVDVPDSLLQTRNAPGFLDDRADGLPGTFLGFDADQLFEFLGSPEANLQRDAIFGLAPGTSLAQLQANGGFDAALQPDSFEVDEEVLSFYVDAFLEGSLGSMPWAANIGVRYSDTDVTATGTQLDLQALEIIPSDETLFNAVFGTTSTTVKIDSDYDNWLPSANFRLNLRDDVLLRLAYSKTVTRPQLTDLAPRVNFQVFRPSNLIASGGNPNLDPFESDNLDLSLEWYFAESSMASIAWFRKFVDDFVVSGQEPRRFVNSLGETIQEPGAGDAIFTVNSPVNGSRSAIVEGFEISVQHMFTNLPAPFDGIGIQANATFVDSNRDFRTSDRDQVFAVTGLSDSQNLVLFYEKGRIQFRVAYNQRDDFLQSVRNGTGGDPIFVEDFAQVDISGSYDINDNFSVFFEGININEEKNRKHGRFTNQRLELTDTGARYALGARYSF